MKGSARMGIAAALALVGCHDVSRFSNHGDHYEGAIDDGDFVRAGIDAGTRLCLVLDANSLQDAPGTISTSDARFASTSLRQLPQLWHDPLSTLSFGEGRVQNLIYAASPVAAVDPNGDVLTVLSLLQSSGVEVRILRSAPSNVTDAGSVAGANYLFGVFSLSRMDGPCSF